MADIRINSHRAIYIEAQIRHCVRPFDGYCSVLLAGHTRVGGRAQYGSSFLRCMFSHNLLERELEEKGWHARLELCCQWHASLFLCSFFYFFTFLLCSFFHSSFLSGSFLFLLLACVSVSCSAAVAEK